MPAHTQGSQNRPHYVMESTFKSNITRSKHPKHIKHHTLWKSSNITVRIKKFNSSSSTNQIDLTKDRKIPPWKKHYEHMLIFHINSQSLIYMHVLIKNHKIKMKIIRTVIDKAYMVLNTGEPLIWKLKISEISYILNSSPNTLNHY